MLKQTKEDGFLVDKELAIKIDRNKALGAPSKTSTKVFIAIGALYGEDQSFIYNLESFFQVLFWVYIYYIGLGRKPRLI